MSLLDKFKNWADLRLRKSQIKILYQNQCAVEFLMGVHQTFLEAKMTNDATALSELVALKGFVNDAIISLTYKTCLEDPASAQLLQINNILKLNYAAINEGQRLSRAQFGMPSGDLVDFAKRFAPAAGWELLSDNEWDGMVHRALESLKT
ncbi:MAG: hypothetical protein K0B00_00370 [Rhodobacteraceae bacterium]|nr:hypothetical protein [Paracoccaceae bacterium]